MEKNNKILIVDDEPKNLKILRIRLEKEYELREATSGEEALLIMKEFEPAIVILDIMMEGISGYEVTERIKKDPLMKEAKIILVSGKARLEEKLEGYKAGAEDYLTKPFNGDELKAKVRVFFKLFNLESELKNINKDLEKEIEIRTNQILKSERMAYVGMHAGEIVHNLQNPMAIIKANVELIKLENPEINKIKKIEKASDKILEIIKKILSSYNRDLKIEREYLLLSDVIKDELDFFDSLKINLKNKINLDLSLDDTMFINASKSHIHQVIGNLIKNALEAMSGKQKGTLRIISADFKDSVILKIEDEGCGISDENLEKVFEPLYTTKDGKEGRTVGNGLGLSFCKKMIETYDGELSLNSKLGEGTEVIIKLPAIYRENISK